MKKTFLLRFILGFTLIFLASCTKSKEIGSPSNPLKFYLIPAQDIMGLERTGKALQAYLEKELDMSVKVELPPNVFNIAASTRFVPKPSTTAM